MQIKQPIAFIDDPRAPETYAAEAVGFFIHAGNVHITFASPRVNHDGNPGAVNRVVTQRIVMPVSGAHGLVEGLYAFLKAHSASGAVPTKEQLQ